MLIKYDVNKKNYKIKQELHTHFRIQQMCRNEIIDLPFSDGRRRSACGKINAGGWWSPSCKESEGLCLFLLTFKDQDLPKGCLTELF